MTKVDSKIQTCPGSTYLLLKNKAPSPDGLSDEFQRTFKEQRIPLVFKISGVRKEEHFVKH